MINKDVFIFLKIMYEINFIDGLEFAKVCKSEELFEKRGKHIQFKEDVDMQLAIFRIDGKLYALNNICPHRHAEEIYNGILIGLEISCPLHGWTYNICDGKNINQKQGIKSLETYQIFEENGYVFVEKPKKKIPKWRQID